MAGRKAGRRVERWGVLFGPLPAAGTVVPAEATPQPAAVMADRYVGGVCPTTRPGPSNLEPCRAAALCADHGARPPSCEAAAAGGRWHPLHPHLVAADVVRWVVVARISALAPWFPTAALASRQRRPHAPPDRRHRVGQVGQRADERRPNAAPAGLAPSSGPALARWQLEGSYATAPSAARKSARRAAHLGAAHSGGDHAVPAGHPSPEAPRPAVRAQDIPTGRSEAPPRFGMEPVPIASARAAGR